MGLAADINRPKETPLHSTGYGEIAGADGSAVGDIGLSIEQRKTLDSRRRFVPKYSSSELGSTYTPAALKRYKPRTAPSNLKIDKRDESPANTRQAMNVNTARSPIMPSRTFSEPPSRSYNPYK